MASRATRRKSGTRRKRKRRKAPESLATVSVDEVIQHRTWAFYGRTGTGKTTVLGTFPKPILLLDINDRGVDSIAEYGEEIQVLQPRRWEDFEDVYWYLKKHAGEYATLGIDTVTELQELAVIHQLEQKTGARLDDEEASRASDWGNLNQSDWGDVGALMKRWITDIRNLPLEVVFNAQIRTFGGNEDSDDWETLAPDIGVRLSPATREHLNAMVNFIGNTFIRQREKVVTKKRGGKRKRVRVPVTEYCLRVGPSPVYDTKFRKDKTITLPDVLIDPTYDDMLALVEGEE